MSNAVDYRLIAKSELLRRFFVCLFQQNMRFLFGLQPACKIWHDSVFLLLGLNKLKIKSNIKLKLEFVIWRKSTLHKPFWLTAVSTRAREMDAASHSDRSLPHTDCLDFKSLMTSSYFVWSSASSRFELSSCSSITMSCIKGHFIMLETKNYNTINRSALPAAGLWERGRTLLHKSPYLRRICYPSTAATAP